MDTETELWEYSRPLVNMAAFKYLVRIPMATDENFLAVVANFYKARKKWAWISSVVGREGGNAQISLNFF